MFALLEKCIGNYFQASFKLRELWSTTVVCNKNLAKFIYLFIYLFIQLFMFVQTLYYTKVLSKQKRVNMFTL